MGFRGLVPPHTVYTGHRPVGWQVKAGIMGIPLVPNHHGSYAPCVLDKRYLAHSGAQRVRSLLDGGTCAMVSSSSGLAAAQG